MDSSTIFVKNLVSEAPLQEVSGIPMPTLEKLLVDILRDSDFFYLQGSESERFIENAFRMPSKCIPLIVADFSDIPAEEKSKKNYCPY